MFGSLVAGVERSRDGRVAQVDRTTVGSTTVERRRFKQDGQSRDEVTTSSLQATLFSCLFRPCPPACSTWVSDWPRRVSMEHFQAATAQLHPCPDSRRWYARSSRAAAAAWTNLYPSWYDYAQHMSVRGAAWVRSAPGSRLDARFAAHMEVVHSAARVGESRYEADMKAIIHARGCGQGEEKGIVRGQVCAGVDTAGCPLRSESSPRRPRRGQRHPDSRQKPARPSGGSHDGERRVPFHGAARHADLSGSSRPGVVSAFRLARPCKPIDRLFRLDILARLAVRLHRGSLMSTLCLCFLWPSRTTFAFAPRLFSRFDTIAHGRSPRFHLAAHPTFPLIPFFALDLSENFY